VSVILWLEFPERYFNLKVNVGNTHFADYIPQHKVVTQLPYTVL